MTPFGWVGDASWQNRVVAARSPHGIVFDVTSKCNRRAVVENNFPTCEGDEEKASFARNGGKECLERHGGRATFR
jgi:hypothetical protein